MTNQQQDGFGQMIRSLRQAMEPPIGLRELARRCDISAAYLSNIERGLCAPPSADVVKAFARELGGDPVLFLQKANRVDLETLTAPFDKGLVGFLRLANAISLYRTPHALLNFKNLFAYIFATVDLSSDSFNELEYLASFMTAYGRLNLEKDNPSTDLLEILDRGMAILRVIMPDLCNDEDPAKVLDEFHLIATQDGFLPKKNGESN